MTNPDTSAPAIEPAPATFTQQQVLDALNEAANDILHAVHAGDEGLRDAINLMVNATIAYLCGEADDLHDVVKGGPPASTCRRSPTRPTPTAYPLGCFTAAVTPPPCTPARNPRSVRRCALLSLGRAGLLRSPRRRRPFADTDDFDFGIGPRDDSLGIGVPEYATTAQIAEPIVAVSAEADAQLARFAAAAQKAIWTALSGASPDADTTDLPPGLDDAVVTEVRRLLAPWLDWHWPAFHAVPEHLTAITGAAGERPG